MGRHFENVWDVLIDDSDEDRAKAKSDLMLRINARLNVTGKGAAGKLRYYSRTFIRFESWELPGAQTCEIQGFSGVFGMV